MTGSRRERETILASRVGIAPIVHLCFSEKREMEKERVGVGGIKPRQREDTSRLTLLLSSFVPSAPSPVY